MNEQEISVREKRIFNLVTDAVWEAGGDGDGVIVVLGDSVVSVATRYYSWFKSKYPDSPCDYNAHSDDSVFIGIDFQGGISFIGKGLRHQARPKWEVDIWLEMWFARDEKTWPDEER